MKPVRTVEIKILMEVPAGKEVLTLIRALSDISETIISSMPTWHRLHDGRGVEIGECHIDMGDPFNPRTGREIA